MLILVEFFSNSHQDPCWRYIARCRIVAQGPTLCGRGGVRWADVVGRLVLERLVALLRILEISVRFVALGSTVFCECIRRRCCRMRLVFSPPRFDLVRVGRHTFRSRRRVQRRSGLGVS